jgi:hypothetical protein
MKEMTKEPDCQRERERKTFYFIFYFFDFILRRHVQQQDGENSGEAVSTARVMDQGR